MENITNLLINNIFLIWISYAFIIAIIDYIDKEISIFHLFIFAIISTILLFNKENLNIFYVISNFTLPIIIFAFARCSKQMVVGGADYIFFPFFLAPFSILNATIIFILSIILMAKIYQNTKKEVPFITVLVCTYIIYQIFKAIILYVFY